VTANQHYEEFARQLQAEIEEECGVEFSGGRIKDKNKKKRAKLNKNLVLDDNFKALWERIRQKTRYRVDYDTGELIRRVGNTDCLANLIGYLSLTWRRILGDNVPPGSNETNSRPYDGRYPVT